MTIFANRQSSWFRWDEPDDEYGSIARRIVQGSQDSTNRIDQWEEHDWLPGNPNWRVLDVACGNANYYSLFTETMGMDYVGCDLSQEMVALSRELYPDATFYEADATALPFDDNQFDMTFCSDLLLHLPPELEDAVIAELRRVARRVAVVHTRPVLEPPRIERRGKWGTISRYETLAHYRKSMQRFDSAVEEYRRNDRNLPNARRGADVFFIFRDCGEVASDKEQPSMLWYDSEYTPNGIGQ